MPKSCVEKCSGMAKSCVEKCSEGKPLPSSIVFTPPSVPPFPGDRTPKGEGLTNRLRFLLLFLECVMFVIAYYDRVFGAKHRGLSLKRFEP